MTEDQIEPLCLRLYQAIQAENQAEAAAIGLELLAGFLTDINRLAWFAERISATQEASQL